MLAVAHDLEQCPFRERSIAAEGSYLPITMEVFPRIAEKRRSGEGVHHDSAMPVFRHPADITTEIPSSPDLRRRRDESSMAGQLEERLLRVRQWMEKADHHLRNAEHTLTLRDEDC